MDSKVPQYQRAVTPTIIDSSASPNLVRGKVLSYNTTSIIAGRGGRSSVSTSDKLFGSTNSMPSPSTSGGVPLSPRGTIGSDIGAQRRNSASAKVNGMGTSLGKYPSDGIAGSGSDSLATAFSVLPRYDLVPVFNDLPSDGIIFAKTKTLPEMLVVFRTTEERLRNPERLNLDRRQLEVCPLLEQEQRLRLLNFQNNSIRAIQNLENLPNLIFLDLYNNKITSLEGPLSTVKGLRVLMAGKNKISAISNLQPLRKLDVLDLHSNEIRVIEGLDGLSDLRVLNLAGNRISLVNNLSSLVSLTELNLRRNNIDSVTGLNHLPALQRVFLSHNSIARMEDVQCLLDVSYLIELSLDGNPISESDQPLRYRAQLVLGMPGLRHLDLKRITEEERANAPALLYPAQQGEGATPGGEPPAAAASNAGGGRHRKGSQNTLLATNSNQQLILSDYDANSVEIKKEDSGGKGGGERAAHSGGAYYSSDDGEQSADEGANVGSSRDERDPEQRGGGGVRIRAKGSVSPLAPSTTATTTTTTTTTTTASPLPRTYSMERKGLQKYVTLPPEAQGQVGGTSSAGIAHLQGLQPPPDTAASFSSLSPSPSAAAVASRNGIAVTSTGLAALARAGKLVNTNSIFDLEVIGPDEKALIAVGDTWEWAANKRLLQNVTEASLYHMKRQTVLSKFGSSHLSALPALKCLRFVFNDFTSLKSVEFIPMVYGRQLEQLTVKNSPLNASCSAETLRAYFVAALPRMLQFNDEEVSAKEREQAELLFGPLLRAQRLAGLEQQKGPFVVAASSASSAAHTTTNNNNSSSSSHYSGTSRLNSKGLQNSILRAVQQQAQQQARQPQPVATPAAAETTIGQSKGSSVPFLALGPHSVGSASLEAMRQALTSSAEPTAGSSGLSQRALQRRWQYGAFCAAFDEALDKIILETIQEMKTM